MLNFDYQTEIKKGYIAKRIHSQIKDVVILNYTDEAVYERRWNEATLNCRGLILNEKTGEVLARPFPKFFNYGEENGLDIKIPSDIPSVTVKLDGSLGISYVLEGNIFWATRGSFHSKQSEIANRIWSEKYSHVKAYLLEGITLLTEIIDSENRVVVDYNGESDLVLLGAIRISDGYDYPHDELIELANGIGMSVAKHTGMTVEEALQMKHEIGYNEEGWVLRWGDGYHAFRLKVKGDKYLDLHRLLYGLSLKKKVGFWSENKLNELIRAVPEEFRPEIESFEAKLDSIEKQIMSEVQKGMTGLYEQGLNSRKEKALYITKHVKKPYITFCFALLDNKKPMYKEFIYKNYLMFFGGEDNG